MEKLRTYIGNYILPIGKPTVFITGYETQNDFYCERIIFFETSKSKIITMAQATHVLKTEWKAVQEFYKESMTDEQLLEQLMDEYGFKMAEADIFGFIIDSLGEAEHNYAFTKIELHEVERISSIMYMERKFPERLEWLEKNTKLKELQQMIHIAKSLKISSYTENDI